MKKIYALLVVCFFLTATVTAQTYYWIGPSSGTGGDWNSNTNWSLSSNGPALPGGQFPNSSSHNVIFDKNAVVNVNLENIDLLSLTVSNGSTAKLYTSAPAIVTGATMTLFSTSAVSPALKINAGCRLEDSADVNLPFVTAFNPNAKGVVDGVWYFAGRSTVFGANGATFTVPGVSGLTNRIDINGTLQFRNNTLCPSPSTGHEYLFFNNGSTFWLDRNGGNSPRATWNANATLLITGVVNQAPSILFENTQTDIGNLVFNCPGMTAASFLGWSIAPNLIIKGNFHILNTNNRVLVLAKNDNTVTNYPYTVNGNFLISGTSRVALGNANNGNKFVDFQVNGNATISGTTFDLQMSNSVVANYTAFKVRGNLNHTAGTFGATSNTTNLSADLFIVELNGTLNQTVSSTGTIDNVTNEVTLLINNPAGVTLSSPVAVSKLSFNSANKGKLNTTNVNYLTINNTGTHSLVVNSPSSTGFVNGPVRRRTSVTTDYLLPTGKGSTFDPIQVRPQTAALSVYQGEYFNSSFADLSVMMPLNGVSNQEFWQLNTISGADAAVTLTLTGAVPGAVVTDGIVVSHYNGIDWTDYSSGGTVITPGTATSGSARSLFTTQNGFYTFGYGLAGALPIRLLTFDAKKQGSSAAQLNWQISSSSNAQKFEVMRSTDGRSFNVVGTVNALDRVYSYVHYDNNLPTGTSYYKLKLVDKDGIVTYSQIVAVLNGSKGVLLTSMIPTVVKSAAVVTISSSERGTMQLMVTDMYGRIVKQQITSVGTGNQQVILNLESLPAGAYQVTGVMNNERVGTIRFVRQ